jgi:hypothetical protein
MSARRIGCLILGVAILIIVAAVALWASRRPYSAHVTGSDHFTVDVPYLYALGVFRRPETEHRLVELSGNGRVIESTLKPVGVALELPVGDGPAEGEENGDDRLGLLGGLFKVAANTQLRLHGRLKLDPASPYLQGTTPWFEKDVRARMGHLWIDSQLVEPTGILDRHRKTIDIRRDGDRVEVDIEMEMEIVYQVPPLPFFQRMVDRGAQRDLDEELRLTRRAIETLLTESPLNSPATPAAPVE